MALNSALPSSNETTYLFLGNSGLLVCKLSLGSWMDYNEKHTADGWYDILDLVISTKLITGTKGSMQGGTNDEGVNRKHIVEGLKASLLRLQLDYVDVVFCHRLDAFTPIEETVRAMDFVINQGWAFYWETREWLASDIREACEIADRLGLIRPIVEQTQHNIFVRSKLEYDYLDLYKKYKLVLTTWSPLAFGTLTGKYSDGKPDGSCFTTPLLKDGSQLAEGFAERVTKELGCLLAQMSMAWAVANENASTVLVANPISDWGESFRRNGGESEALDFPDKITPEVKAKIDEVVKLSRRCRSWIKVPSFVPVICNPRRGLVLP